MKVFRCRACHSDVTVPLREVPLPDIADASRPYDHDGLRLPRLAPGTYGLEPPDGTARRGAAVLGADDVRGVRRTTDRRRLSGCCGPDGDRGPNLVCAGCGTDVATESSDCWTPQQVRLEPQKVKASLAPEPLTDPGPATDPGPGDRLTGQGPGPARPDGSRP